MWKSGVQFKKRKIKLATMSRRHLKMRHCQTVLSTISEPSRHGDIAATTHAQLGKRSKLQIPDRSRKTRKKEKTVRGVKIMQYPCFCCQSHKMDAKAVSSD